MALFIWQYARHGEEQNLTRCSFTTPFYSGSICLHIKWTMKYYKETKNAANTKMFYLNNSITTSITWVHSLNTSDMIINKTRRAYKVPNQARKCLIGQINSLHMVESNFKTRETVRKGKLVNQPLWPLFSPTLSILNISIAYRHCKAIKPFQLFH